MDTEQALTIVARALNCFLPEPASNAAAVVAQDAAFLARWLHDKAEKTQEAYRRDILRFYTHVRKPLGQVTLDDLQSFMDSLLPLKPSSRTRSIAAVKSALSFGLRTGYLVVNVGAVVKLRAAPDASSKRMLSEEEVIRMVALEPSPRNHAILRTLYHSGLRVSELCALTWADVQDTVHGLVLNIEHGKGDKQRFVLLNCEVGAELLQLRSTVAELSDPVFRSQRGGPLDRSQVLRIVQAAARRAGISRQVSPHWLRHSSASHALEHGATVALVRDTLGHASLATTSKYTHARPNSSLSSYLKG